MEPSYIRLHKEGRLLPRVEEALARLAHCTLCPRACGVDRRKGASGFCKTGRRARIASFGPHFGEEAPLVGRHGSGTLFVGSCNLLCSFCQNFEISHLGEGEEVGPEALAGMMLSLARQGCHNINIVTPTHVVPQILEALPAAIDQGLSIPLVYNCGGYEKIDTLRFLEGVFDIAMPDFKFWDPLWAERFCGARDYPERAREAMREMHRQVGDLLVDSRGIAQRGLLVRHLVMPNQTAGTREIMGFLAREISQDTCVNVMDQYRPCGRAREDDMLARRPTAREYREAVEAAADAGLRRLDKRDRPFLSLLDW